MKKKVIFWLFCLVFLSLYIILDKTIRPEIDFLDVGQGDSSLIKLPGGRVILIDGGPDNLVLKRLGENLPFYRRKIDLIILSHFHDDHLIGLLEILHRYQVSSIIYAKDSEMSALLRLFLHIAEKEGVKVIALENKAKIDYAPDCSLEILSPFILNIKSDPNNSLVARLGCRQFSALFSGDNSSNVEAALLKNNVDLAAKIFKASHHGSKTANSEAFLRAINPVLSVISVGIANRFGHPDSGIIERIDKLGIGIKRTDKDGTIKIGL